MEIQIHSLMSNAAKYIVNCTGKYFLVTEKKLTIHLTILATGIILLYSLNKVLYVQLQGFNKNLVFFFPDILKRKRSIWIKSIASLTQTKINIPRYYFGKLVSYSKITNKTKQNKKPPY